MQSGRPGQGRRDLLYLLRVSLLELCGPTQTDRERGGWEGDVSPEVCERVRSPRVPSPGLPAATATRPRSAAPLSTRSLSGPRRA